MIVLHCGMDAAMEYHVKPIGKTCAATGEELVPGSVCHSVLVERDGQWVRLDFSEVGWSGPPEETLGYWRCVVPEPATKPRPLDADALMRCFEQMSEEASPAQDKFLYVLALLLLQKRRLRIEGSRRDGEAEYLELIGRHGEGPFEVRDQQLSDEEIERLQRDMIAQLTAEWH
jgi:hypothetical protein